MSTIELIGGSFTVDAPAAWEYGYGDACRGLTRPCLFGLRAAEKSAWRSGWRAAVAAGRFGVRAGK